MLTISLYQILQILSVTLFEKTSLYRPSSPQTPKRPHCAVNADLLGGIACSNQAAPTKFFRAVAERFTQHAQNVWSSDTVSSTLAGPTKDFVF